MAFNQTELALARSLEEHPSKIHLNRYACDELGPRRKAAIPKHLGACQACREAVDNCHIAVRRLKEFDRLALARYTAPRSGFEPNQLS